MRGLYKVWKGDRHDHHDPAFAEAEYNHLLISAGGALWWNLHGLQLPFAFFSPYLAHPLCEANGFGGPRKIILWHRSCLEEAVTLGWRVQTLPLVELLDYPLAS